MKNIPSTRPNHKALFVLLIAGLVILGNSCSTLHQSSLTIDPQAHQALLAMSTASKTSLIRKH